MYRLLSDAEVCYLKEIAPGHYNSEITELINQRFNKSYTVDQIKNAKARYKIKSGMQHKGLPSDKLYYLLTPEQDEYVRKIAKGHTCAEITAMLNKEFGLKLSVSQIKFYKQNHGIRSGINARFKKGQEPPNKGKKLSPEKYAKAAPTMFKKGQLPIQTSPVGTESWRSDGYLWVKVAMPNKWRQKHRLIYEAAHGPVSPGSKIIFADGNRKNFDINNLICVTSAELARLNQKHLIFENAEATKTGVLVARLISKTAELKGRKKS